MTQHTAIPTPAPLPVHQVAGRPEDGVYTWMVKDRVHGKTVYEVHFQHGRLVFMNVNGVGCDILRQLNQVEDLVLAEMRTRCAVKAG